MRILILAGVAAAALTLTACNREEPAEPATDMAPTAETGSMSADTGGATPSSSGSGTASGSSSGRAATSSEGAGSGSSSAESMPAVPPPEAPTTEATRAGAKERAESTNLHPSGQ